MRSKQTCKRVKFITHSLDHYSTYDIGSSTIWLAHTHSNLQESQ
jgi:hypothetical protein